MASRVCSVCKWFVPFPHLFFSFILLAVTFFLSACFLLCSNCSPFSTVAMQDSDMLLPKAATPVSSPLCRTRCKLPHSDSNDNFLHTAFLPPKAKRTETTLPLNRALPANCTAYQSRKFCFAGQLFNISNVAGDGRCGYRALATYLGISWQDVMNEVMLFMVSARNVCSSEQIVSMTIASDQRNPCPQSCWLSSDHLTIQNLRHLDLWQSGLRKVFRSMYHVYAILCGAKQFPVYVQVRVVV